MIDVVLVLVGHLLSQLLGPISIEVHVQRDAGFSDASLGAPVDFLTNVPCPAALRSTFSCGELGLCVELPVCLPASLPLALVIGDSRLRYR